MTAEIIAVKIIHLHVIRFIKSDTSSKIDNRTLKGESISVQFGNIIDCTHATVTLTWFRKLSGEHSFPEVRVV
jgi:hypothetical protein